ncbi:hypothetical protein APA_207 [Pseudanabaena sp. lw0831]|nr:hypothetical protein APA_207 [Pseudanabaena sp. lw0831]
MLEISFVIILTKRRDRDRIFILKISAISLKQQFAATGNSHD